MSDKRRIGVVVLDFGRPDDTERAAASARSAETRVLIVENGARTDGASGEERLCLRENRGFAGGMNAGMKQLLSEGCDRFLLLNNDAVLEPGCPGLLAEALDDPKVAACGPIVLRESDGRVESRGVVADMRWGRVRLAGHGELRKDEQGVVSVGALSGAVLMLHRRALERVGWLDEGYFLYFEDIDWCVRAREAGFDVRVVRHATARHAGSRTIGPASSDRFYYSARNHIRFLRRSPRATSVPLWFRCTVAALLQLAHAAKQDAAVRRLAIGAVLSGLQDAGRSRYGRRPVPSVDAATRGFA